MAVVESAEAGLRAAARGATVIQLRAPGLSAREIEREAMRLRAESPVPVLVSSRCDIALAAQLSGVNLPENDIAVADARRLLGDGCWISRSVHTPAAARESAGADLIIFGPVWETPSHPAVRGVGIETLRSLAEGSSIPVIAIGGVTEERIPEVMSVCAGYAAISRFA
jgi:thiamine-phosphate diphosphorylase